MENQEDVIRSKNSQLRNVFRIPNKKIKISNTNVISYYGRKIVVALRVFDKKMQDSS